MPPQQEPRMLAPVPAPIALPSHESDSDLYRRLDDDAADSTKYLIAHRSITLLPAAQRGQLAPFKESNEPTVDIFLTEGRTATKHVELHAEDVYIYAGTRFNFKQKLFTLTANRIFCVPAPANAPKLPDAEAETRVEIDCSGRNSEVHYTKVATAGAEGGDSGIFYGQMEGASEATWIVGRGRDAPPPGPDGRLGVPGRPGSDGISANDGRGGGQINLRAQLVSQSSAQCDLYLNVSGGQGGTGQTGGDGGTGGNCQLSDPAFVPKPPVDIPDYTALYVGAGGPGGRGGNAGKWGPRGSVNASYTTDSRFTLTKPNTTPATTKGGASGAGGSRGRIIHLEQWPFPDGSPRLGAWPPAKGTNGVPGQDAPGTPDPGTVNVWADAQAGAGLNLDHMMMIIQRLEGEHKALITLKPRGLADHLEYKVFKESVDWLAANVKLLKKAPPPLSPAAKQSIKQIEDKSVMLSEKALQIRTHSSM